MGMDVYGVGNPDAYFRANIWSWHPIHSLIKKFAEDLADEETIEGMASNSGYGLKTKEACIALASRLESWMEHNVDGLDMGSEAPNEFQDQIHGLISGIIQQFGGDKDFKLHGLGESNIPSYKVDDDHLKEFIQFLRECDGFKVL